MKTKILIILAFFFLSGLFSCIEFLEEEPKSMISPENFPVSQSDVQMMVAGALNVLKGEWCYDRCFPMLAGASSDIMETTNSSGERYNIRAFTYTSTNEFVRRTWQSLYVVINNSNVMIEGIPNTEMTDDLKNQYIGVARFLRAFSYFHLVRLYGEVPVIEKPVRDFTSATEVNRDAISKVYELIVSDLEWAEMYLPEEWPGNKVGKPDLGSCKSLLTEVYITMAGYPLKNSSMWAKAASKAKEVIDLNRYQLLDDFRNLWGANKNTVENIFSIQNGSETDGSMMAVQVRPGGLPGNNSGWGMWTSTIGFLQSFDDIDLRKDASLVTEFMGLKYDVSFPNLQPAIRKYWEVGRENFLERNRRAEINIPVFRYAEILLFFAEALNEANSGPTPEAYNAINQVRIRAGLDPLSGLDQNAFRDAVIQERAWELAFENKRRFDLIRTETFMDVMSKHPACKDNIREYHKLFPVPDRELQINPALGQNEGF